MPVLLSDRFLPITGFFSVVAVSDYFYIHPENPQRRLIRHVAEILDRGGIVACPTDCSYVLLCHLGDKAAVDRIRLIRQLDDKHQFTLLCRDLREISTYAKLSDYAYRLMKSVTPGAYTFILPATKQVPNRLQHKRRKTIGYRVPKCEIALALLEELEQPVISTTLILPGETDPLNDPADIRGAVGAQIDAVIDGGTGYYGETTVVELLGDAPIIVREGRGDVSQIS